MVLGYAAQYKDVIENKRTDAESNRKKDEVWLQIAKEFNSKVYHQRSAKQLRQLYKNMKLLLKKDLCGEDKGNRSFMDLLNTLSQQDSVAQYIAEQMSPDGAGSQAAANGRHMADDYEDSKVSESHKKEKERERPKRRKVKLLIELKELYDILFYINKSLKNVV